MRKLSIKCMTSITMMKLKKKNIFIILMSVFILMTATPDILVPAASAGIRLWGLKVVPGLIMGLIFVGCLDYYMPQSSAYGTFLVILCSLLCGFPTGALNCIQYSRRHNNNSFIADIMPYCNTSSPGFTINYIYYGLLSDYINIRAFLIEMGGDFTFIGNQYHLVVGSRDLYIDLLLFHRRLRSLVAIELKIGEFEAEYAGKMQLYLTALDEQIKLPDENPSIGIIICKSKDKTFVEYALKQTNAPIGVATYQLRNTVPEDMLPDPDEIAKRLKIFEEK